MARGTGRPPSDTKVMIDHSGAQAWGQRPVKDLEARRISSVGPDPDEGYQDLREGHACM